MANSALSTSVQANYQMTLNNREDTFPLRSDDFQWSRQWFQGLIFVSVESNNEHGNLTSQNVTSDMKTVAYGDGKDVLGWWTNMPPSVKPTLDVVQTFESDTLGTLLTQLESLKALAPQCEVNTSLEPLKSAETNIKRSLRSLKTAKESSAAIKTSIDNAIKALQQKINDPVFDSWALLHPNYQYFTNWGNQRQQFLDDFYRSRGVHGSPNPLNFPHDEPHAYANVVKYFHDPIEDSNLYHNLIDGFYGAWVSSMEHDTLGTYWGQEGTSEKLRLYEYLVALINERIVQAASGARDLSVRIRGSRRIGRYIVEDLQAWQAGHDELMGTPASALEASLWTLYGNMYSADAAEVASNWADLQTAGNNFTALLAKFMATPGKVFEGFTDADKKSEEQFDAAGKLLP